MSVLTVHLPNYVLVYWVYITNEVFLFHICITDKIVIELDYMSNTVGVLEEAVMYCPSPALGL
jgi:hypothetical protein